MRLDGQPIVAEQTYRVTVNNFMAEGGDGYVFPKNAGDRLGGGQDIDALIDYLKPPSERVPPRRWASPRSPERCPFGGPCTGLQGIACASTPSIIGRP